MKVTRIHTSYHKCLTVYFARVFKNTLNKPGNERYRHFNSELDQFYETYGDFFLTSVNNHRIDLDRLQGDVRVSHLIRDPRDLVVSGYFYHKRGSEDWTRIPPAVPGAWDVVNGTKPVQMPEDESLFDYLNRVPVEDGLLAEIDFRQRHFESMAAWPKDDERVLILRYEDIIGSELAAFSKVFRHLRLGAFNSARGLYHARYYSIGQHKTPPAHIRNVKSAQWREHFTPVVREYFDSKYPDLLAKMGYA